MMRRLVVLSSAVVAVALLVVAGILGSRSYLEQRDELASPTPAPIPDEVTEQVLADYLAAIETWPLPLPVEDALPEQPPPEFATGGGEVGVFVSMFYRCAWEGAYIDGPPGSQIIALDMLAHWAELPSGVSFADNSDGGYKADVIDRARAGDNTTITALFTSSCQQYLDYRVDPPDGLTIDKPIPLPPVTTAELCVGLPTDVPCDPAFGPDRVVDTGPMEFARGDAVVDSRGVPIAYVVAPGDVWFKVDERFQLGGGLWSLNCYRFEWPVLYVGDVVNLSRYRVASVGVNNGSSDGGPPRDQCLQQTSLPPQI
jgi:hypothetical protein